jgi:hypothetical protein
MGEYGSGRRYGYCKTLVEDCMYIDIHHLSKSGCLEPGRRYSLKWQNGCDILIETTSEALKLFYVISFNGQPQENVHIKVPLTWTPAITEENVHGSAAQAVADELQNCI